MGQGGGGRRRLSLGRGGCSDGSCRYLVGGLGIRSRLYQGRLCGRQHLVRGSLVRRGLRQDGRRNLCLRRCVSVSGRRGGENSLRIGCQFAFGDGISGSLVLFRLGFLGVKGNGLRLCFHCLGFSLGVVVVGSRLGHSRHGSGENLVGGGFVGDRCDRGGSGGFGLGRGSGIGSRRGGESRLRSGRQGLLLPGKLVRGSQVSLHLGGGSHGGRHHGFGRRTDRLGSLQGGHSSGYHLIDQGEGLVRVRLVGGRSGQGGCGGRHGSHGGLLLGGD